MLSDVLIIKMGQYIPLDPLTTLNGMMINYIIKRSCATHLWTWDLKLKIKQQPTVIISCLKTSSYPVGKYAQGSPHGIIPIHIYINKIFRKPNILYFFVGPIAVYYAEATCLERNLTNLIHVYDFITMSISFQRGRKGGFPTTLVITSWKPPSAFLVCLRSQKDLEATKSPRSMEGLGTISHWAQVSHGPFSHNWCQWPADSIADEASIQERR